MEVLRLASLHQLHESGLRRLRDALDRTPTHDLFSVEIALRAGRAQLWVTNGGVVVTEIVQYDLGPKVLNFWLAGGELEAVLRIEEHVLAWAKRDEDVKHAALTGRRGWVRALRERGWGDEMVTLHRRI